MLDISISWCYLRPHRNILWYLAFVSRIGNRRMRCPYCEGQDDKVIDSRTAEEGGAIRRRRECTGCGERFTTFERIEEIALFVSKRTGDSEEFDLEKVTDGIAKACKNRPIDATQIQAIATAVEEAVRSRPGTAIDSSEIGQEVLKRLADVDEVAYLRFASVYLRFDGITDFAREVGRLRSNSPVRV